MQLIGIRMLCISDNSILFDQLKSMLKAMMFMLKHFMMQLLNSQPQKTIMFLFIMIIIAVHAFLEHQPQKILKLTNYLKPSIQLINPSFTSNSFSSLKLATLAQLLKYSQHQTLSPSQLQILINYHMLLFMMKNLVNIYPMNSQTTSFHTLMKTQHAQLANSSHILKSQHKNHMFSIMVMTQRNQFLFQHSSEYQTRFYSNKITPMLNLTP